MMTANFIKHFASDNAIIIYLIIIAGMIIEGEVVVVLSGIFAHLGYLHILPISLSIVIGGSLKTLIGYSFGHYLQTHHSNRKLLHQTERRIKYFLPKFSTRPFGSVFLSRFFWGMHWLALIFSGYKRIKLRTYIKAELLSLITWSVIMLSIGYFFSSTALYISRDFRKFAVVILACFVLFFIIEKVVAFIIEYFEKD